MKILSLTLQVKYYAKNSINYKIIRRYTRNVYNTHGSTSVQTFVIILHVFILWKVNVIQCTNLATFVNIQDSEL